MIGHHFFTCCCKIITEPWLPKQLSITYIVISLLHHFLARYLTIRLRARVFYEQIVNEAQPSWLSLVDFFTCCCKITSNNWTMATKATFNYVYRDISSTSFSCTILRVRGQVLSFGFLEASVYTVQIIIIIILIKTGIMIHMQKKDFFPQTRLCARLHKIVVVFSWYILLVIPFQNVPEPGLNTNS